MALRFFLVDRVDQLEVGQEVRGVKAVTLSEGVLHDHFPDHPLYPGTLVVEALAQLGGFLVEASRTSLRDRAVLAQIERARFHRPARPGDRLDLHCQLLSSLEGAAQVRGEARIDGEKATTAELTFVLRPVDSERVHQQRQQLYRLWTRELPGDWSWLT